METVLTRHGLWTLGCPEAHLLLKFLWGWKWKRERERIDEERSAEKWSGGSDEWGLAANVYNMKA